MQNSDNESLEPEVLPDHGLFVSKNKYKKLKHKFLSLKEVRILKIIISEDKRNFATNLFKC